MITFFSRSPTLLCINIVVTVMVVLQWHWVGESCFNKIEKVILGHPLHKKGSNAWLFHILPHRLQESLTVIFVIISLWRLQRLCPCLSSK
ncbi:hypothetical protein EBZ80_20175 [bacterium]|nr:hypothetical protein [bacterium]